METRINKLCAALPGEADGILITDPLNQRYLSGLNYTDGYIVITRERAVLLADSRYIEIAEKVAADFEVVQFSGTKELKEACDGIKTLAFEDLYVTCADKAKYEKLLEGTTLIPCGSLLTDLREHKDEGEIELITKAQRIAEEAFDHILGFITPDKTETEVALELEFFMRSKGASGTSFDTIAVSGSASSLPHGEPRDRKLERGFLTMDFGALYQGYCSDMTRTVVIGRADQEMKAIYERVLEAQLAAIDAAAPGKSCKEVDAVARTILDAHYPGAFGHGLGHGVGMYIHESPRVSPASDRVLEPGHIITIEPGVYLKGKYGVRIEDMLAIGEKTAVNLTKAPKNLIELF